MRYKALEGEMDAHIVWMDAIHYKVMDNKNRPVSPMRSTVCSRKPSFRVALW